MWRNNTSTKSHPNGFTITLTLVAIASEARLSRRVKNFRKDIEKPSVLVREAHRRMKYRRGILIKNLHTSCNDKSP
ncbi:hypothetical protein NEOLEDRAFT_1143711 [Neolentinus lepideus HHB14362 ss-1]|uniref:Uncharacterized protein n=1 Tax=Neolentinus lepideus HHB14362 ss-1 TaxID=1314782 RepID=A0A165MDF1_9AGAM|nr:hypothetical protein NEOLEDRAFT_1143711 [Neolentinus lepideus HHB14362 ss-1]